MSGVRRVFLYERDGWAGCYLDYAPNLIRLTLNQPQLQVVFTVLRRGAVKIDLQRKAARTEADAGTVAGYGRRGRKKYGLVKPASVRSQQEAEKQSGF